MYLVNRKSASSALFATYKLWPRNENRFASSNRLWRRSTLKGELVSQSLVLGTR